ncbi:NAD(P)-dependent oxidoreductase [Dactylosporangium sp. CA-139066]|uniref:NAD(P)-dependent oxidoreductase n=1 Tax=Dactylosporangium sp. CA-139066 TaxID=3239930 RepID=UPI003D925967
MTAPIAVLGAGGRVGRAVIAEAARRGHPVIAIVRGPARHDDLRGPGVTLAAGDALDSGSLVRAAAGARGLVCAVTPFSAPPASFSGFDPGYYERVFAAVTATGVPRAVVVGLFATMHTPDDGRVLDDPELFPAALRPFARAHADGIERLRAEPGADWIVLSPPPGLHPDAVPTGRYRLTEPVVDRRWWDRPLAHADLALAVLDELDHPTARRAHLAVHSVDRHAREG